MPKQNAGLIIEILLPSAGIMADGDKLWGLTILDKDFYRRALPEHAGYMIYRTCMDSVARTLKEYSIGFPHVTGGNRPGCRLV